MHLGFRAGCSNEQHLFRLHWCVSIALVSIMKPAASMAKTKTHSRSLRLVRTQQRHNGIASGKAGKLGQRAILRLTERGDPCPLGHGSPIPLQALFHLRNIFCLFI